MAVNASEKFALLNETNKRVVGLAIAALLFSQGNEERGVTMAKDFLTDEQVEQEIARLTKSDAVKLARREQRIKYARRQRLYALRALEKRGKELEHAGVTLAMLTDLEALEALQKELDGE